MEKRLTHRSQRGKKAIPAALCALAAAWSFVIPVSEAREQPEPGEARAVRVAFDGPEVHLPASAVNAGGTTMVPAQALLEGLGYRLEWSADRRELTARRASGDTIVFRDGSAEAMFGNAQAEQTVVLPLSPYMEREWLWIPLRIAAERSGMEVTWNPFDGSVTVRDPQTAVRFRVGTRADNGAVDAPEQLQAYMKEEWSTDVRFSMILPEHYHDKVNLMIAAGDPTDLMLVGKPYQYDDELFRSFASDLTDMLDQFPRLKTWVSEGSSAARTIDGRLFAIPRPSDPHDAPFPAIRQDWLDRLGLAEPKTMEELYAVLLKFVQYDPDGDGKHNTIGMTGHVAPNGLGTLSWVEQAFTGSPERFIVKNGKVEDTAAGPGERQALEWLSRAFQDGLLDKEFAVQNGNQVGSKLLDERTGLAAVTLEQAAQLSIRGHDPDPRWTAYWVPLSGLSANGSEAAVPWNGEGAGQYIIPRTVSRELALHILKWLDRGAEMAASGEWSRVDVLRESDRAALDNLYGRADVLNNSDTVEQLPAPLRGRYEDAASSWKKISYKGRTIPQAGTIFSKGDYADMNRQLEQLKIKVIMGAASLDEWDRHIERMKASEAYNTMLQKIFALLPEPGSD